MLQEEKDDRQLSFSIKCHQDPFFLLNSICSIKMSLCYYVYLTDYAMFVFSLFLSGGTLAFGVAFWTMMTQWRTFKNYVFLNIIFMGATVCFCFYLVGNYNFFRLHSSKTIRVAFVMSRIMMSHWMLVATVMFYMDIVQVFNTHVERKYLYTNVFVWLVPPVEAAGVFTAAHKLQLSVEYFTNGVVCVMLLASTLVYLRVLYTLVLSMLELEICCIEAKRNIWQKIVLSTAASITSGITSFLPVIIVDLIFEKDIVLRNIVRIVSLLNIICIIVFFLSMKDHREAWAEYRRRRRAQRISMRATRRLP